MGASFSSNIFDCPSEGLCSNCCDPSSIKTTAGHTRSHSKPVKAVHVADRFVTGNKFSEEKRISGSFQDCKELGKKSLRLNDSLQDPFSNSIPPRSLEPSPMTGWTHEEQRFLLFALDEFPHARKHPDQLHRCFVKTHRAIPHKSMEEIRNCYEFIERNRIAIFSKTGHSSRTVERLSA